MAVASLYATALFDAAGPAVRENLQKLDLLFCEEPDYIRLMDAPVVSSQEKQALLTAAFGDKLESPLLNFLRLLADNCRFGEFSAIVGDYTVLCDRAQGLHEVTAITAAPLPQELTERLRGILQRKLGGPVRLSVEVDAGVLGGIKLISGGHVLDATARAGLEQLRRRMGETESKGVIV